MNPLLLCNLFIIYYFLGLLYSAYYHMSMGIDEDVIKEVKWRNNKEEMFIVYSMILFILPTFWPLYILYNLTKYGRF